MGLRWVYFYRNEKWERVRCVRGAARAATHPVDGHWNGQDHAECGVSTNGVPPGPPPLKPEVADEIGIRYGRVPLKAKTKFHNDQMKVEIWRLGVLIANGWDWVSELEAEIKYVKRLEVPRGRVSLLLLHLKKGAIQLKKQQRLLSVLRNKARSSCVYSQKFNLPGSLLNAYIKCRFCPQPVQTHLHAEIISV